MGKLRKVGKRRSGMQGKGRVGKKERKWRAEIKKLETEGKEGMEG